MKWSAAARMRALAARHATATRARLMILGWLVVGLGVIVQPGRCNCIFVGTAVRLWCLCCQPPTTKAWPDEGPHKEFDRHSI